MAAKKKSDGDRGMNSKGKVVGFTPIQAKPTEAFTKPGQKATGLGKSSSKDRFSSSAKTPVVKATDQLAGGSPLGTSFGINPLNKGQIAGAAGTILGSKGSGQVTRGLVNKIRDVVGEATFDAAARGLGASGAGGKIKSVMTPFGKTIAGTKIGSEAEQGARMAGLIANAEKTAKIAANDVGRRVAGVTTRAGAAGKIMAAGATAAAANKKVSKKKKP